MGSIDKKRLALVRAIFKSNTGETTYKHGTGYFITKDLVLTAGHVLSPAPSEVKVRLEEPSDRKDPWLEAKASPVWEDQKLDAALLKIDEPIHDVEAPLWCKTSFDKNVEWHSTAYPLASAEMTEDGKAYKSAGLEGKWYVDGGGGQGLQELDLGVEHESEGQWNGISGAPVFVGDELVGIIKSYKTGYKGKRLDGVPVNQFLSDPAFQRELKPKWLSPLPRQLWILILISENSDEEFSDTVRTSIDKQRATINKVTGLPSDSELRFVEVKVTEALNKPTRWYEAVEAICEAPIMVADVTSYQPAVMLMLGIRAVVRRGVTVPVTSTELNESLLSELPFNIQETKLIFPWPDSDAKDTRHPINRIGEAVVNGLMQLRGYPTYLDLPAYDAVRCAEPQVVTDESNVQVGGAKVPELKGIVVRKAEPERILMLCSFNEMYKEYWNYVSVKITRNFRGAGKSIERMLDISSPRLVGQALYESIRWTPCCIIDWTHWRPNVFFELGVRLSCSDIGPICLIEEKELDLEKGTFPEQKRQLLKLLRPISYKLHGSRDPFKSAFERYHSFLNGDQEYLDPDSAIPHNATYRTVVNAFDWRQESFARTPHEELRASIEILQGKDPEKDGGFQALFSSNAEFKQEIRRSGRERWIAAWYYFRNRYEPEDFEMSKELRNQLSALTECVVRELGKQTDPHYQRIYNEAVELMDKLDKLDLP